MFFVPPSASGEFSICSSASDYYEVCSLMITFIVNEVLSYVYFVLAPVNRAKAGHSSKAS